MSNSHHSESPNQSPSPESEAITYEGVHPFLKRKKHGIFYTPIPLVDHMLEKSLRPILAHSSAEQILGVTILDPACGSGVFLIRAFRMLAEALVAKGGSLKESAAYIACNCLYGVDLDKESVRTARALLLRAVAEFAAVPHDLALHIAHGNSLIARQQDTGAAFQSFDWDINFPRPVARGFDLVIGNPPYGLSRDEQLSAAENKILQRIYATSRNGKLNKYLAFMAMGYQKLNSTGRLCFVVPNSWLGIKSAQPMRKLWLEAAALHEVHTFSESLFSEPGLEAVVFCVNKAVPTSTIAVRSFDRPLGVLREEVQVPLNYCLEDAQCKIPLRWSASAADLLRQMRSNGQPLSALHFSPAIALQAYAVGKGLPPQSRNDVKNHVFHSTAKLGSDYYHYLEGGDVGRYRRSWSGRYLRHGNFLAEPQRIERFTGPRVLLREILGAPPHLIQAVFCEEPCLYNKSVLHILGNEISGSAQIMKSLAALLNSIPLSFVLLLKGRKTQRRLFPKLLNEDLRELPLPRTFFEHASVLSQLYESREASREPEEQLKLDGEIDKLVCELFGLGPESLAEMRELLMKGKKGLETSG